MADDRTSGEKHIEVTPVEARQGTGPPEMLTVLTVSLMLAVAAGAAIYFFA
jgi:hypothetical protein